MHIDGLGVAELPGAGGEGVGARGEGAHRTQIDDIAGQLRVHHAVHIHADLHVVPSATGPESIEARNLIRKANTTGAMDATSHGGLDQRSKVLVLNRPLCVCVCKLLGLPHAGAVGAIDHRLVLQIALSRLIADGAVKRVVGEEEFHHSLTSFLNTRSVGVDFHTWSSRHGTRSERFRCLLVFNQAHSAVASDGQTFMVTKTRDFNSSFQASCDQRGVRFNFDRNSVDLKLDHVA
eukprot:Lithocolla_globosa_v1_NODE_1848_length_2298_cov_11.398128.p2 type:complete len:235 gc:universal NODE_1848_length_2298_cov_11.398128:1441-2145(+)